MPKTREHLWKELDGVLDRKRMTKADVDRDVAEFSKLCDELAVPIDLAEAASQELHTKPIRVLTAAQ